MSVLFYGYSTGVRSSRKLEEKCMKRMREKLMEKEGQLKYLMRQYIIEPIFGHLKYNLGYRHFLLRGIKKVNGEFKLMC
ncbi:MAG: transposase, partial [Candidatus Omnitrophota bacterium]